MKRRILSLAIVLCMIFVMFPTTAFAAESYGIYVGSTEVTTANYKNITGPGISGKVYYDPATQILTLDNATITSYYDTDPNGGGDVVGLLSAKYHQIIELKGTNTICPELNGKQVNFCSAVATTSQLLIRSNGATLSAIAKGGKNNVGMLAKESLILYGTTVNAEGGDSSDQFSYGILTSGLSIGNNDRFATYLSATAGNCPNGESIGGCTSSVYMTSHKATFKSGTAAVSFGLLSEGIGLNSGITYAISGTSTEGDSVALYTNILRVLGASVDTSAGTSEKGSSIGIFSAGGIETENATVKSAGGTALNGTSVSLCCESAVQFGKNTEVNVAGGKGSNSIGMLVLDRLSMIGASYSIKGGIATNGDSCGVICQGEISMDAKYMEISGGKANNGYSVGILCDGRMYYEKDQNTLYPSREFTVTGYNNATLGELVLGPEFYWAGSTDINQPTRRMKHNQLEPISDTEIYQYLYIVSEDNLPPTPFYDVPKGVYYVDPVLWAVESGLTNGVTPDTFAPKDVCTRGQVVTFLWRACGSPEPETTENPFTDVQEGKFYYKAVLWAVENGITNGMTETTFGPNEGCTRGHVATFLWRCLYQPEATSSENPFSDVIQGKFYYDAVLWAAENGITTGTDATHFSPNGECTRAQIVTFLYRAAEDLAERPDEPPVVEPVEPTDPTEPTEPSEPSEDPTEPTEPSEPSEDPTDPTEPSEPEQESSEPTEPSEDSSEPTENPAE